MLNILIGTEIQIGLRTATCENITGNVALFSFDDPLPDGAFPFVPNSFVDSDEFSKFSNRMVPFSNGRYFEVVRTNSTKNKRPVKGKSYYIVMFQIDIS